MLPAAAMQIHNFIKSRSLLKISLALFLLSCVFQSHATLYTSSGTGGNWSSSATWGGAGVPGNSDNVIISHGTTVTVNGSYTCNNVTIGDATATAATLTVSSTNSLTINGACSINPSNGGSTYTLNAATGSINIAGTFSWSTSGTNIIEASSGTLNITPAITISSSNQSVKLLGAGNVVFNSSFTDNYNKLVPFSGGTFKFYGNYTVSTTAASWASGTALFYGTGNITANSNLTLYNLQTAASASTTLASAAGTVIIGNAVTLGSGSTFTASEGFELDGNWTNSGGTFSGGANTVTFNGTTTLSGTTTFGYIQVGNTAASNTVTVTFNNSVICSGLVFNGYNKARTLTVSNGDTLKVNGNVTINQPTAAKTNNLAVNGGTCIVTGTLSLVGTSSTASYCSKVTVTSGLLSVAGTVSFDACTVAANQLITLTSTGVITFGSSLTMAYGTLSSTGTGTINFNGASPSYNFGGSSGPVLTTTNGCTMNFAKGFTNNSSTVTFAATSSCNFTGNGTITANAAITFGNVQIMGTDTLASTGNTVDISGNCTVTSGASLNAFQNLDLNGNWISVATGGNYIQSSGTMTVYGDVIDSGAITACASGGISLVGTGANISGTGSLNDSAGIINVVNGKTITSGSSLTFGTSAAPTTLNIATGSTISNGGTIVLNGSMTGADSSSTWLNNVNGGLAVTGELLDIGSLDASTVPNTVTYNGSGDQTITSPVSSYYNLTIGNSGTKTLIAPVQVDNAVDISGAAVVNEGTNALSGLATLSMSGTSVLELQRNTTGTYPELSGAYTLSSGTVVLSQTDNPAIITGAQYYNLVLTGNNAFDISNVSIIKRNLVLDTAAFLNNNNSLTVDSMFIDSSSGYSTLYNTLNVYGIGLYGGTLDDGGNNVVVKGAGGWTNSGGNFVATGATTFYSKFGTPQTIGGSTPTTFYYLQVSNPGNNLVLGLSPAAPTVISGYLDLTSGTISTDASNILRALDTVTVINGSSTSYVNGPMTKVGSAPFVFPVGKGGILGQAGFSGAVSSATEVTAEYFNASYSTLTPRDANLSQVSNREYWTIERSVTADSLQLQLFWTDATVSDIIQCDNLSIAHYTGGTWNYVPGTVVGGSVCAGSGSGSLQSTGYISTFSPFTFGSFNGPGGEALPVSLVSFTATPTNKVVQTKWQTAAEINSASFVVERSADAREFTAIGTMPGAGNSTTTKNYALTDESPLQGVSYYRLRQTDFNGNNNLSQVVAVNLAAASAISIYPNPAKDQVSVNIINPSAEVIINVYNAIGQRVFNKTSNNTGSATGQSISISTAENFPAGIYTVSVTTNGNEINEKLVVQ